MTERENNNNNTAMAASISTRPPHLVRSSLLDHQHRHSHHYGSTTMTHEEAPQSGEGVQLSQVALIPLPTEEGDDTSPDDHVSKPFRSYVSESSQLHSITSFVGEDPTTQEESGKLEDMGEIWSEMGGYDPFPIFSSEYHDDHEVVKEREEGFEKHSLSTISEGGSCSELEDDDEETPSCPVLSLLHSRDGTSLTHTLSSPPTTPPREFTMYPVRTPPPRTTVSTSAVSTQTEQCQECGEKERRVVELSDILSRAEAERDFLKEELCVLLEGCSKRDGITQTTEQTDWVRDWLATLTAFICKVLTGWRFQIFRNVIQDFSTIINTQTSC
eukprot:sb/3466685/